MCTHPTHLVCLRHWASSRLIVSKTVWLLDLRKESMFRLSRMYIYTEKAMAVGTPPLMAGRASRAIMLQVEQLHSSDSSRQKTIELFSKLFAVSWVQMFQYTVIIQKSIYFGANIAWIWTLEVNFNVMRSLNLRFTYLLTYSTWYACVIMSHCHIIVHPPESCVVVSPQFLAVLAKFLLSVVTYNSLHYDYWEKASGMLSTLLRTNCF